MGDFCVDSFWNSNDAWNNSWPQITECFQASVLHLLPCLYLWIFLSFHVFHLMQKLPDGQSVLGSLFLLKMLSCLVLIGTEAANFVLIAVEDKDNTSVAVNVAHAVKLVTYVLVCVTTVFELKKSVLCSPGLFLFFLLSLLVNIVPFYSKIILKEYVHQTGSFVLFYINYGALLCSYILHCFNNQVINRKESSPAEAAPVLSQLTLWWTTSLVIQGYKNPLTEEKIYPLNTSEKSTSVVPNFLFHLAEKIKHCQVLEGQVIPRPTKAGAKYSKAVKEVDDPEKPPLVHDGYREKETSQDLENGVGDDDKIAVNFKFGSKPESGKGPSLFLWKVICKTFYKPIIVCCILACSAMSIMVVNPIIMKFLIEFTSGESQWEWHGYLLAVALFVSSAMSHVFMEIYYFKCNIFAVRVKTVLVSAIYRKSLRLSSEARQSTSSGEVIHLLSKDCNSIWTLCSEGFVTLEAMIQLSVGLTLVYLTVGVSMLSGLAFLATLFALKSFTLRKHAEYDSQLREFADQRMRIASQVFNGIKVLKLYAWEDAFKHQMCAIREKELSAMFKFDLFRLFITFAWTGAIFWMTFFTFMTYILIDDSHQLTASTVFVTMAYYNHIRRATNNLASVIDFIVAGIISARRIGKFLLLKEIEKSSSLASSPMSQIQNGTAVTIRRGDFGWSADKEPVLENINTDICKGSLVAIVGMVGSGKSSLLSAILGEMITHGGQVLKQGSVAYVPQEAWIQNDTVCNNILFGAAYQEENYNRVLQACALMEDLAILPHGDKTEIGEKGINLSGGQKQRISLARSVYQNTDVYLLDDPLSAVDSHVGQHIFQQVIGQDGILKGKTRILVTHGVHWLPQVDKILVMTNGRLTEQGSLSGLMDHKGPFAQFLSQYLSQQKHQHKEEKEEEDLTAGGDGDLEDAQARKEVFERLLSIESQENPADDAVDSDGITSSNAVEQMDTKTDLLGMQEKEENVGDESTRLIEEEEVAVGRVSWSVYLTLIKFLGTPFVAVMGCLYLSFFIYDLVAGFWLSFWVDDPLFSNDSVPADCAEKEEKNQYYLGIYSLWGVLETLVIVIYCFIKAFRHVHASRAIHENFLTSILASPIQFFDTTPIGRILARLSNDISVVDTTLLLWIEIWMHSVFAILSVVITIIINIPAFLAVAVPVVILFYFIEKFYLPTSCQLRRLENKWLSPIFSHASESMSGVSVIRALGEEDRFIKLAEDKTDFYQRMKFATLACERWLSIWLGLLSDVLVLFAGILAVWYKDELSPGLTGLCLSLALVVTDAMQLQVRIASFLEMDIVSVERILQYSNLPSEAPRYLPNIDYSDWPTCGRIEFIKVGSRYRSGLDLVLKDISFTIEDGEKVGIVGRTGAGKSSLLLSLFRLIEPCHGKIVIDGVDISKLGLSELRQKLTILPQDPVLFTGSLRTNLDPFEEFSDAEIWKSLEHCHLKTFVDSLNEGLDYQVGEGGDNLSIGQRQLVCLGRALLRKTKILVLDEATAAVDLETDDLIQKTIRSEFQACTVLTIAHRLNTVMDYDRILVLDKGQIVEFDTPSLLLRDENSLFYKMVHESQVSSSQQPHPSDTDTNNKASGM